MNKYIDNITLYDALITLHSCTVDNIELFLHGMIVCSGGVTQVRYVSCQTCMIAKYIAGSDIKLIQLEIYDSLNRLIILPGVDDKYNYIGNIELVDLLSEVIKNIKASL